MMKKIGFSLIGLMLLWSFVGYILVWDHPGSHGPADIVRLDISTALNRIADYKKGHAYLKSKKKLELKAHEAARLGYRASWDPWGQYYVIEYQEGELRMVSKGPDQIMGTSDDMVSTVEL